MTRTLEILTQLRAAMLALPNCPAICVGLVENAMEKESRFVERLSQGSEGGCGHPADVAGRARFEAWATHCYGEAWLYDIGGGQAQAWEAWQAAYPSGG